MHQSHHCLHLLMSKEQKIHLEDWLGVSIAELATDTGAPMIDHALVSSQEERLAGI